MNESKEPRRSGWRTWRFIAVAVVLALVSSVGVATAMGNGVTIRGGNGNGDGALVKCPGGMLRLGHTWGADTSVFPGDPDVVVDTIFTVEDNGFLVEEIITGVHAGTHLDAPAHFIIGGRSVDELAAEEFVWPAYVIDLRDRMAAEGPDFLLTEQDIKDYEDDNGRINEGSLVIINTGVGPLFGTTAYEDAITPGFSEAAVQWLFDKRDIAGLGADGYGPDATTDNVLFQATYTALLNDGVTLPGMNNLDHLNTRGDIIIASTVPLEDGSGFIVDPLACKGR